MNNPEDNKVIGLRIRRTRENLGLSREVLAEKADISVTFLADIEQGKKSTTIQPLGRLATALDVSTDYIVYGVNNSRALSPIDEMLKDLSPYQLECAHEILRQYVAAVKSASPQEDAD